MKYKVIFIAILLVIVGIAFQFPISNTVDKQIVAKVYIDGIPMEDTTITIKGNIVKGLFSETQSFSGNFFISYYKPTCRDDMQARIGWEKGQEYQWLRWNQNASVPNLELDLGLIIDKNMSGFAIGLQDGTIISTSEELYHQHLNTVIPKSWDNLKQSSHDHP